MFLIALYIVGLIWANLYGWATALVALPLVATVKEEDKPNPIALGATLLFIAWPAGIGHL